MPNKTLIFVNPIAGRGRSARIAQRVLRRLQADGFEAEVIEQSPDAYQPPKDISACIVIGGDGTLRAVAGRFWNVHASVPPLLIVPAGTANLMAQHLNIRWTDAITEQISAALKARQLHWLDAAVANGKLFFLMAGVGIDGSIAHALDRIRRGPINYASWLLPAATALSSYQYPSLTVRVDGRKLLENAPAMVFIGNVPEHGIGFAVTPGAESTDGALDVVIVRCRSTAQLISQVMMAVGGELQASEEVTSVRGKQIEIDSPVAVPVQIDGDPAGHTPMRIGLLPAKMAFILPVESR